MAAQMPPTADDSRYQQQRLAAIEAAAAVFAHKGFHGASTKEIAARLGIKQGSLYYYFKSKEQALGEVCLFALTDYVGRMERIAASDQPFAARLLATVGAHIGSYREKNEALKVYNDERLYLPKEKRTRLKALGSRYRQLLQGVFEDGVREGAVDRATDCHFAAQATIGLCNAWGDHVVRDPGLDLFDITHQCTDLLRKGFAPQPVRQTITTE